MRLVIAIIICLNLLTTETLTTNEIIAGGFLAIVLLIWKGIDSINANIREGRGK